MSTNEELKGMVMTFRVSELQMLLGFASQNKTGRKSELQARAVSLLKNKSVPHLTQIQAKIRELYKTIQHGGGVQQGSEPPTSASAMIGAAAAAAARAGSGLLDISPSVPQVPQPQIQPTAPNSHPSAPFLPISTRQSMYSSMYAYQQPKMTLPHTQAPVHPDVRIKKLPFYDIMGEVLKPSSLAACISSTTANRTHESSFIFYLTPQQATEVSANREVGLNNKNEYSVQVQLRFSLLETSCEQDDIFPPGVSVKVNGKLAQLPSPVPTNRAGVEPKRPPRPVNISANTKLCPSVANHISVTWTSDYSRGYVLAVYVVKKLSASDLLNRLKAKGIRHADFTTGLIKEKLAEDNDCEIATTSLRVSLLCPLGKNRMSVPARSTFCSHLQCFDASLYLQMNEKRPTWSCPVCDKPITYDSLVIDGYFQEVLTNASVGEDVKEIQLHKDGSWSCTQVVKEETKPILSASSPKAEIEEILDDGDDNSSAAFKTSGSNGTAVPPKIIEIDLTSDTDDDITLPPPSAPATPLPVIKTDHISDSSNSSGGIKSGVEMIQPMIISLDSPSPPSSPQPQGAGYQPPRLYPQVVQGNRPLLMQIRMPPDSGRYLPY